MSEKKLIIQAKKYKGDSSVVSARLPIELIRKLDDIAEKSGKTRNELFLTCLEFAIDNLVIDENK